MTTLAFYDVDLLVVLVVLAIIALLVFIFRYGPFR